MMCPVCGTPTRHVRSWKEGTRTFHRQECRNCRLRFTSCEREVPGSRQRLGSPTKSNHTRCVDV